MNINPKSKRILCFGDSNVWGRVPGDDNSARFPTNIRWTGVLQKLLGDDYEIIEEGLNGRTSNRQSPHKAGKNGAEYLFACLESQNPLDIVILFLGKNELKEKYNSTPQEIGVGIEECINAIKSEGRTALKSIPQIILVSPAIVVEKERLRFGKVEIDFLGATEKSKELGKIYGDIAKRHKIKFIDLSTYVKTSKVDGVHLDQESHQKIANLFCDLIKDIS